MLYSTDTYGSLVPLKIWSAVVLVNGMIMTIYLWHLTAFVVVMVAAWLL
ncbi:MAG: hypothetical protein HC788_01025, partial [Sphingopyxis sp.]|nr:hypothetical protein [Sphingopyxis sp.]